MNREYKEQLKKFLDSIKKYQNNHNFTLLFYFKDPTYMNKDSYYSLYGLSNKISKQQIEDFIWLTKETNGNVVFGTDYKLLNRNKAIKLLKEHIEELEDDFDDEDL